MRLTDTVLGLLVVIFGLAVVGYSRTFPAMPGQNIGPALFPLLVGGALILCGFILVWSRQGPGNATVEATGWVRQPQGVLKLALVIAAVVLYAMALETVGFFITAFIFLGFLLLVFGVRPVWIMPIAATVTVVLHGGFYTLLRVPLPWGWLETIAW